MLVIPANDSIKRALFNAFDSLWVAWEAGSYEGTPPADTIAELYGFTYEIELATDVLHVQDPEKFTVFLLRWT